MKYLYALFALAGCLPAYSIQVPSTDGGPVMEGGPTCPMKYVGGKLFFPEPQITPDGITVAIDGFPDTTIASDSSGNFTLPIACPALGTTADLVLSGTYLLSDNLTMSPPILTSYFAPPLLMDGSLVGANRIPLVHGFVNQDNMMGIRSKIEQALSLTDDSQYAFMYGRLVAYVGPNKDSEKQFHNFTFTVTVGSGAAISVSDNCRPTSGNCCPFYANTPQVAPFIVTGASSSPNNFAVVCPASLIGTHITFNQTADMSTLRDNSNLAPSKDELNLPWPSIVVPLKGPSSTAGTFVDWAVAWPN